MRITGIILFTLLFIGLTDCTQNAKSEEVAIEDLIYEANNMHNAKKYKQSIKLLDQAAELDPNNVQIYFNRAASKSALKDIDGAIYDCLEVVRLDKKNMHALLNLGHHYISKKDYEKAITYFDRAQVANLYAPKIKLIIVNEDGSNNEKPDYSIAYEEITYFLGIAFMKNKEYENAIIQFESCLELNAYLGDCYCRIGECYEALNEKVKACEFYARAKKEGNTDCNELNKACK